MRPSTKLFLTSSQPRMQRSHRMQESWSTAMAREESSLPRATVRLAKRGCEAPAAFASVSNSQSPEFNWRAQGEGWSAIINSRSVLRAPKTFSELVTTFRPGSTGRTQAAVSTRAPVSTTQSRQTPTGVWFCRWQSVGMLTPFIRAASKTLVPAGTRTDWPSIVISTTPGGVAVVVILGADSDALGFSCARSRSEADPAGAFAFQNVRVDFGAKMFQDGLNRRGYDLTEPANRSEAHGLRELVEQRQIGAVLRLGNAALRPAHEHVRHFLRTNAAGHAFAARLVAIETHGVQSHVQHAGRIVANNDRAGAQHGAGFGKRLEIKSHVAHRGGKIA